MKNDAFYDHLKKHLLKSTNADRTIWASKIVEEEISLRELADLLHCKRQIAMRFLWLLSDVGSCDSGYLLKDLPFLFELRHSIENLDIQTAFAKYWELAGIPPENEAEAIDLLFGWFLSADIKVTVKSNALFALLNLTQKYPELKQELRVSLEHQLGKNTANFDKRLRKVLQKLGND
ncbi:MAG: hypothetical protein AB8B69_00465 [Chitinophagales bacterium]